MQDRAYLDTVTYLHYELTGDEAPYFVGRWFEKEIDGVRHMVTTTDGSHLYFMVDEADWIDLNFTIISKLAIPVYAISIDGEEPIRHPVTDGRVALPDRGPHTIRVLADGLTETEDKWLGEIGFAFKSVTTNGRMVGIRPTDPVVFFYGDSITEGIVSIGTCGTSNSNSASHAYGWYASQALGVVPYYIGYGGSGFVPAGSFHPMMDAIDSLSATRAVETSAVANITPSLIVVNHGTNDAYTSTPLEQTVPAMKAALARLQEKYPGVTIVYMIPFFESHHATVITQAAVLDELAREMDGLYVVHTKDWDLSYTDGIHPNAAGAEKAGHLLAEAIRDIVGESFFD